MFLLHKLNTCLLLIALLKGRLLQAYLKMLRHGAKGARSLSRRRFDQVSQLQDRTFTAAALSTSCDSSIAFSSSARRSSPIASTSRLLIPSRAFTNSARRNLATHTDDPPSTEEDTFDLSSVERVSDQVDVCIVGGGPAGLSAAIRLMQLAKEQGNDEFRVVVLEKGGEVGEV